MRNDDLPRVWFDMQSLTICRPPNCLRIIDGDGFELTPLLSVVSLSIGIEASRPCPFVRMVIYADCWTVNMVQGRTQTLKIEHDDGYDLGSLGLLTVEQILPREGIAMLEVTFEATWDESLSSALPANSVTCTGA